MPGPLNPETPIRPAHTRRRERTREPRTSVVATPQIPRLEVGWPPLEVFSSGDVDRIIDAAYRLLEEIGIEIRSAEARAVFAKHAALVDTETSVVRIGRDLVMAFCALAPERFVL